jgi:eukaryotic-like serine/threonine-protein kinase
MDTNEPSVPHLGATDRDLQPGQKVGEYVVEEKIGEGGFGTVFRASHPLIGKVVAIKVLNRQYSAQPEMVSRFVSEARAVNQIRHRHIIDIFAFGQVEDGRHYYVMEYLEGQPLDEHLAQHGRMPLADAIPILRAVARALDAAHAKGIAHRDLKPENVFLVREPDGTVFPKLLDFGIAKLLTADSGLSHKTRTGAPIGTPYYMSPEQCRGRDVDHRTDVYAFGIMTYKMLTGEVPFDGEDYMDILLKQISEAPPAPSSRAPELPESVDQGIAWMLKKDPAERPPNLVTAVRALEDAAAAAGISVEPGPSTGVHSAVSARIAAAQHTPSQVGILPTQGSDQTMQRPAGTGGLGGRTPMRGRPSTGQPRGMTPGKDTLGAAATMDAGSLSGSLAVPQAPAVTPALTAAPIPPHEQSKAGLYVLAGISAIAVAATVYFFLRTGAHEADGEELEVPAAVAPARPASPAPTPPAPPARGSAAAAPGGAAAGAGATDPAAAGGEGEGASPGAGTADQGAEDQVAGQIGSTVTLDVSGVPEGTEVHGPDGKIGTAPGRITLPRGDEPVELTFEAAGYQPLTREVVPSADAPLPVTLERLDKGSAAAPSGKSDNEPATRRPPSRPDRPRRPTPPSGSTPPPSRDTVENPFDKK